MRILFVHQNFPGQFRHIIKKYVTTPGCEVACIGESANMLAWEGLPGIRIHGYGAVANRKESAHPYLDGLDLFVKRGQKAARTATEIKKSGFIPDVIVAHTGWGEALFLRDVFPDSKILSYCEFYYNADGSDVGFENHGNVSLDKRFSTRTRNFNQALSFISGDWGISPTEWQKQQYPEIVRQRISVIHDGIDTDLIAPDSEAHCTLRSGLTHLKAGDEVITFVNRNFEPYRGFHIFAYALPLIQKLRPNAQIVLVGSDGVSYGSPPPGGTTYRKMFMDQVKDKVDFSRIHFIGHLPHEHFIKILQISAVHVYLTYPFVLSWSLMEAMAAGCLVVASKTKPVEEVIRHEENGLLVDFFSPEGLATAIDDALSRPSEMQLLRENARETIVKNYDLNNICLPRQIELINSLADGKLPIPS